MHYNYLVILHVFGATTLLAAIIAEIYILWRKQEGRYARLAQILGFIIGFEVITGGTLALLSSTPSLPKVCTRISLYFLTLIVAEFVLYVRMRKIHNLFPLRQVLTLPAIGFVFTILVVLFKTI